jgi:SPP1 gp7 family putative phage head morphogenesis protein
MSTLFDMQLRHQIYLEGVKVDLTSGVNRQYITKLDEFVKSRLDRLPFEKLDSLSRTGVTRLIADVEKKQRELLKEWRSELKASLREYAKTESAVTAGMFKAVGKTPRKPGIRDLWADVVDANVSGPDTKLDKMLTDYVASQTKALKTAIRSSATAGQTKAELYDTIRGTKDKSYKDGLLRKFGNQGNAVGSTGAQHVKGRVQSAVAELSFDQYRWVSVLDSGTTDICRGRAGQIYHYGSGPVPPAHFRCRSSTVPVADDVDEPTDTDPPFFEWVQSQPEEFIRDIFPKRDAEALISGRAKRADFEHFDGIGRLTLAQFRDKLPIITA